jgi:hypothetical protein
VALTLAQDAAPGAARDAPSAPVDADASTPAARTTLAIDGPLDALAGWDPAAPGSPLPGVSLRLQAPRLELDGALIEGLEIELAPNDAAPAEAAPPAADDANAR